MVGAGNGSELSLTLASLAVSLADKRPLTLPSLPVSLADI
jgi:hypothetical protein